VSLWILVPVGLLGALLHALGLFALLLCVGASSTGAALICAWSSPLVYYVALTFEAPRQLKNIQAMRVARWIWSAGLVIVPALGIAFTFMGYLGG